MALLQLLEQRNSARKTIEQVEVYLEEIIDDFLLALSECGEFAPGITKVDRMMYQVDVGNSFAYIDETDSSKNTFILRCEVGCYGDWDYESFIYPLDLVEHPTKENMEEWHKNQVLKREEQALMIKEGEKNKQTELEEYEKRTYERLKKKFEKTTI